MTEIEVKQRKGEPRKDYLIRVVVAYLKDVDHTGRFLTDYPDTIKYDDADCDGDCLSNDLQDEFVHIDFEELIN